MVLYIIITLGSHGILIRQRLHNQRWFFTCKESSPFNEIWVILVCVFLTQSLIRTIFIHTYMEKTILIHYQDCRSWFVTPLCLHSKWLLIFPVKIHYNWIHSSFITSICTVHMNQIQRTCLCNIIYINTRTKIELLGYIQVSPSQQYRIVFLIFIFKCFFFFFNLIIDFSNNKNFNRLDSCFNKITLFHTLGFLRLLLFKLITYYIAYSSVHIFKI